MPRLARASAVLCRGKAACNINMPVSPDGERDRRGSLDSLGFLREEAPEDVQEGMLLPGSPTMPDRSMPTEAARAEKRLKQMYLVDSTAQEKARRDQYLDQPLPPTIDNSIPDIDMAWAWFLEVDEDRSGVLEFSEVSHAKPLEMGTAARLKTLSAPQPLPPQLLDSIGCLLC